MKKLLIALTAVATGFFASTAAADETLPTGVGFESLTAGDELTLDEYWTASGDLGAQMTVTGWADAEFPSGITRPAVPGEDNEVNYLTVKTTFGNPLVRKAFTEGVPTVVDNKIFFDSMIKFTAVDEDPAETYVTDGDKLIVYVKDNSEDETSAVSTTNLMVIAGTDKIAYDLGSIDIDVWHRLTIKAVKAYTGGSQELAFTVYVDQQPKAATVKAFADVSNLTTEAKGINAANRLFPAIHACTTITSVGFDGQGCIDDLVFADALPTDEKWADENAFSITMGENITSYTWTSKSAGVEVDSDTATGDAVIPRVQNMTVEISDVVFASGSWKLAAETEGCDYANYVFSNFGTGSATATLIAEDTTPRVSVKIGEAAPVTYPSLAKAFEAINALQDGAATIAFDKAYYPEGIQLGTYEDEGGTHTEATLSSGATITLDLAGCTIFGPEGITDEYAIMSGAPLMIVDTVGGGKIVPSADNDGAVFVANTLGIAGGSFDGAVEVDDGYEIAITGGSFDYATNSADGEDKFKFELSDDYVAEKDDESDTKYWVVKAVQKFTVSFWDGDTQLVDIPAQTIKNGGFATKPETDPTKDDYTFVAWVDGEKATFDFDNTPITADTKIYASWTATLWTITYYAEEDSEEVLKTDTYTIETRETKELYTPTLAGKKFTGWVDADGETVASLAEKKGEIKLYATWENLTVVAQITGSVTPYYSLADAVAAAVKDDVITVIADTTETNVFAKVDLKVVNNAVVTFVSEGAVNYSFQIQNNAQVTLGGTGTWVKGNSNSSSMFQVVAYTTGKLTVNGGTFIGGEEGQASSVTTSPSNLVQAKGGSLEINGGTFTNYRCDAVNGHCVCAEGTNELGQATTAVVNGGTFTAVNQNALPVYAKEGGTLTIPGTSTAKFNQDESAYCADGYETKLNETSGFWEVVAKVSPYIDPTDPTSKQTVEAADQNEAIAKAVVAVPTEAQTCVGAEAYKAYFNFTATQAGDNTYDVQILGLKPEVVEAPTTADLVAKFDEIGEDGLTVVAKPGLYYGVKQAAAVGAVGEAKIESAGMAMDQEIKLPVAKQGDAGFYKIVVDVKAFPVE